jgi:leucyl aminopeptidase (aminopeptidase T)
MLATVAIVTDLHRQAASRPLPLPNKIQPMPNLGPAIDTVIHQCLRIKADENVVVVVDPPCREIGASLWDAVQPLGAEVVLVEMDQRATNGSEPPATVTAAMAAADVVIAPTSRSLSHTVARKQANEAGARVATMPGVTADMLARLMTGEFEQMAARSRAVAALLSRGSEARISCPLGTDLRLDLGDREAISDDGDLHRPGAFGNLPCGEAFIAPLGGEGRIVAVSLAPDGVSDPPAILTVENGHIVAAHDGLGPDFLVLLQAHGEAGTNLAELGVGTNERAKLTGNLLEDEKILGTVHVAFGASGGIGGTVSVPIHLDALVAEPTLHVDGHAVLEHGRLVI